MVLSRISACVFAASDPRGGFLGTLDDLSQHPVLNHRFEVTGGVLAEESSELLKAFFRDKRKKRRKERGEVAEWTKAVDSKSTVGSRPPWVRIPPSPLF